MKIYILKGCCSLDHIKEYLEKYNSIFNIDSRKWYEEKTTTDIFIKSEKVENLTKTLQIYYEKDLSKLRYEEIDKNEYGTITCDGIFSGLKPHGVVNKYNELKSSYAYDFEPEIFNYPKKPKKSTSNKKVKKNSYYSNDNYSNNNNDNDHHSNNSNNSNNNNDNESEKKSERRGADLRDRDGLNCGRVDSNGDIRDRDGVYCGKFEDNGDIRDRDGQVYMHVDSNGDVKDRDGQNCGHIDDNGDVRDKDGLIIGNADGISKEQAAYNYFKEEN